MKTSIFLIKYVHLRYMNITRREACALMEAKIQRKIRKRKVPLIGGKAKIYKLFADFCLSKNINYFLNFIFLYN